MIPLVIPFLVFGSVGWAYLFLRRRLIDHGRSASARATLEKKIDDARIHKKYAIGMAIFAITLMATLPFVKHFLSGLMVRSIPHIILLINRGLGTIAILLFATLLFGPIGLTNRSAHRILGRLTIGIMDALFVIGTGLFLWMYT